MNNSTIKNILNCDNSDIIKVKKLADKFDINTNNSKNKICSQLKKTSKSEYPCNFELYDDLINSDKSNKSSKSIKQNIILKKHQSDAMNHILNNRGIIVVHSVGTGKTLTSIASAKCLLLKGIVSHVIVITPTSLQHNFIGQCKLFDMDDAFIKKHFTFYT